MRLLFRLQLLQRITLHLISSHHWFSIHSSILYIHVLQLVLPFVDAQVAKLSEVIGFDQETLCYTLGMFLCYPLGFVMSMLPHGKIKHMFSFLMGCFLLQFTIGKQWVHHLITVLISYVCFLFMPKKDSKTIVPLFVMTYLTVGHLHRQYVNYLGWDLGKFMAF